MIAGLAVFAGLAALICARARAATPALVFGVIAIVLFTTTPLGSGLPHAVVSVTSFVGDIADKLSNSASTK